MFALFALYLNAFTQLYPCTVTCNDTIKTNILVLYLESEQ